MTGVKTVAVSVETWRMLMLLKAVWGLDSLDDVIRRLIDRADAFREVERFLAQPRGGKGEDRI